MAVAIVEVDLTKKDFAVDRIDATGKATLIRASVPCE
jgi:hypothetical protein